MMKKLAILFTALLACAIASGQDEIWINPDTTYAAADATAAEIEAVSSIYNASGFELDVDWQLTPANPNAAPVELIKPVILSR